MSKKRDRSRGEHYKARRLWIHEGDLLFAEAEEAEARADAAERLSALWLQAGGLYSRAARLFRSGSLGLKAKEAYLLAAQCYSQAGKEEESEQMSQRAQFIPEYWEDHSR